MHSELPDCSRFDTEMGEVWGIGGDTKHWLSSCGRAPSALGTELSRGSGSGSQFGVILMGSSTAGVMSQQDPFCMGPSPGAVCKVTQHVQEGGSNKLLPLLLLHGESLQDLMSHQCRVHVLPLKAGNCS